VIKALRRGGFSGDNRVDDLLFVFKMVIDHPGGIPHFLGNFSDGEFIETLLDANFKGLIQ